MGSLVVSLLLSSPSLHSLITPYSGHHRLPIAAKQHCNPCLKDPAFEDYAANFKVALVHLIIYRPKAWHTSTLVTEDEIANVLPALELDLSTSRYLSEPKELADLKCVGTRVREQFRTLEADVTGRRIAGMLGSHRTTATTDIFPADDAFTLEYPSRRGGREHATKLVVYRQKRRSFTMT